MNKNCSATDYNRCNFDGLVNKKMSLSYQKIFQLKIYKLNKNLNQKDIQANNKTM